MVDADASRRMTHANALLIGSTGVLLRGRSGVGKSSLTLDLVALAASRRLFACLIGDDRVELTARHGRLIARPHPAIAGAVEERGVGILPAPFEPAGVIRCVVDLRGKDSPAPQRYPLDGPGEAEICGVRLPLLEIQAFDAGAARKIFSFIHKLVAI
jgi:HPr kinase/phosphorylase